MRLSDTRLCVMSSIYRTERDLFEIYAHPGDKSKSDLVDKLWDYLNFFEFVAGLVELKQITREDLKLLFEYPLRRIARSWRG